jgi:tetratricopeptide (TPR) repeat protein
MEQQLNDLVQASAGNPSAKSKAQELLSFVCDFAGDAPGARAAYSAGLDTLEAWQGKDYAVMVVRRAGDRMLEQEKNPAKAILYFDLLLEKYPDHQSKVHALYQSGLACIDAKSYKDAADRFDKAVAADPKSYYAPWALRKKAVALAGMVPAGGDFAASLAALDQLEQSFPNPHWGGYACYRRGFTLECAGKPLEAMVEYQKGMGKYPTSPYSIWSQKLAQKLQEKIQQQMMDDRVQKNRDGHDLMSDQGPSTGGPQG